MYVFFLYLSEGKYTLMHIENQVFLLKMKWSNILPKFVDTFIILCYSVRFAFFPVHRNCLLCCVHLQLVFVIADSLGFVYFKTNIKC